MKKNVCSILAAGAVALASLFLFVSCSNEALLESDGSAGARSLVASVEEIKTLSSDLNPGYGKAVYFAGEFDESNNWTVAVRGTYEDGKWICNVTSDKETFEYKCLVGDWDAGETVVSTFEGLTELGKITTIFDYHGIYPSGYYAVSGRDVNYGDAVYFKKDGKISAVRGEYYDYFRTGYSISLSNAWVYHVSRQDNSFDYYDTTVYVGSYDLGENVYPTFANLTWEDSSNHIYE